MESRNFKQRKFGVSVSLEFKNVPPFTKFDISTDLIHCTILQYKLTQFYYWQIFISLKFLRKDYREC